MHVGISVFLSEHLAKSGIGTYTRNLLQSLAKIDSSNKYTIYANELALKDFSIQKDNFEVRLLHSPSLCWKDIRLPAELLLHRPEILFDPTHCSPWYCPCKFVATVHDIAPLIFNYTGLSNRVWRYRILRALKHADRILVPSKAVKNDIVKRYDAYADKIHVVYHAYNADIYKLGYESEQIKRIQKRYNINGTYILYVGLVVAQKNIERLLQAFSMLKRDSKMEYKLVIAGRIEYSDIFQMVRNLGLEKEVIFTNYVPQSDLPFLMSGADVFVFPSLHEGFGTPPLEAMACGVPVVTSNVSSLPEVVGDAGIVVNPYDVEAIAGAIYRVLSNADLRQQMCQKGLERVKMFSWEKTAQQTLQLFEELH